MDIKVVENGVYYSCFVEDDNVYAYINKNEDNMNCLDDEQKILKAIYDMWVEDNHFLKSDGYNIPENNPHYGERYYYIENISPNDIIWDDYETPSKVLKRANIKLVCTRMMEETLGISDIVIGINILGSFFIMIDDNTILYFYEKNFDFNYGHFHGKYKLKKNRGQIIRRVQNAIHKNINLVNDLYSVYE